MRIGRKYKILAEQRGLRLRIATSCGSSERPRVRRCSFAALMGGRARVSLVTVSLDGSKPSSPTCSKYVILSFMLGGGVVERSDDQVVAIRTRAATPFPLGTSAEELPWRSAVAAGTLRPLVTSSATVSFNATAARLAAYLCSYPRDLSPPCLRRRLPKSPCVSPASLRQHCWLWPPLKPPKPRGTASSSPKSSLSLFGMARKPPLAACRLSRRYASPFCQTHAPS